MSETTSLYGGSEEPQGSTGGNSTVDTAREQAEHVAGTAAEEGQHVAEVAKEQAGAVADEARSQAKDLFKQAQDGLRDQAAQQQERVAAGLQSVSEELSQMAQSSQSQGVASDLARQAAGRAQGIASWLGQRDPGSLLSEVKSYARRNPGTFIAVAAVAGVLAGRLTRSLASGDSDSAQSSSDNRHAPEVFDAPDERAPMRAPTARIVPADASADGVTPPSHVADSPGFDTQGGGWR
ncbi:hypothetical protein [Leifsonia poae]|uniref:hypothetical protein n=1 Tax=Leifsonia poae TaxID=110933 RepID=UPI003D67A34C